MASTVYERQRGGEKEKRYRRFAKRKKIKKNLRDQGSA